jgi:hypothetical protein
VTNLADLPEEIWCDYNQRACVEQRIEELKSDLAADDFCLQEFFATEAAFLSVLMLFNLLGEFQRATGMTDYLQPATLRVLVLLCGAILGRVGHRTVLHRSSAWGELKERNSLFDKVLVYEIPTSRKPGQFCPQHGHILGIARADVEMAFIGARAAPNTDVHKKAEGAESLKSLPHSLQDDSLPVRRQLPVLIKGLPFPGIGKLEVLQVLGGRAVAHGALAKLHRRIHPARK